MDDKLAMRVGHRPHDLHEQTQDRFEIAPRAVRIDRLPVDVFERQIGPAFDRNAGVVQHRNGRMLQPGQDGALARNALG